MKHSKLLLLLAATLLLSCDKENSMSVNDMEKAPIDAITTMVVSIDEAEKEVLSLLNMIDVKIKSEASVRKIANRYSNGIAVGSKSDNGEVSTPLVHIFNFEDNRGYAIVAGDRRVSPVLCLADKGSIEQDDVISNPGLLIALSEIDTYYRLLTGLPVTDADGNTVTADVYSQYLSREFDPPITDEDPDEPVEPENSVYSYVYGDWEDCSTTGTILPCHWSQHWPFNANCTTPDGLQAVAGCVAIAVGQIMYHWGLNYTYKGTYWNWTKMHEIINESSSQSYPDSWDLAQRLIRTLGLPENLDMTYGVGQSGALSSNAGRTFLNFGFAEGGSFEDYDFNTLQTNLAFGPVLGRGDAIKIVEVHEFLGIPIYTNIDYPSGHSWVYDQALVQRRHVSEYKDGRLNSTYYQTRNLVHINWGWNGESDGYYLSTRLNANEGGVLTRCTTITTYGTPKYYQFRLQMNCGIRAY